MPPTWSLHTQIHPGPSLHHLAVAVKCDASEILNTAETFRKGRRKLEILFLYMLTNPNNISEERNPIVSHSVFLQIALCRVHKAGRTTDPGAHVMPQQPE